jgi:hypothetical protein
MSNADGTNRLVYLSLALAVMSFGTSIYQSYLFTRQVDIMQFNVARGEYMRTCKDVIDAYFQVKLKAAALARTNAADTTVPAIAAVGAPQASQLEAAAAVSRFAALGTYLANFQDEAIRVRYTALSHTLERTVNDAGKTPREELPRLFEPADKLFHGMNEDCVRWAKGA